MPSPPTPDPTPVSPRRDFLKSTATTAAGTALLAAAPHRFAHASPENPIKIGLIGCGGRGTGAANHALNAGADLELVAVCDVDPETATHQVALLSGTTSPGFRAIDAMASGQRLVPDDLVSFDSPAPVQPGPGGFYPVAVPGVTKPFELWY